MANIDVVQGIVQNNFSYTSLIRWLSLLNQGSILTDQFILTAYHCVAEKISEIGHLQALFGISTKQEALYLESYDHEIHHSTIRKVSLILIWHGCGLNPTSKLRPHMAIIYLTSSARLKTLSKQFSGSLSRTPYGSPKEKLIRTIIYHPDADLPTNKADLAILQLTNPITKWTDFIMPACIPFSK